MRTLSIVILRSFCRFYEAILTPRGTPVLTKKKGWQPVDVDTILTRGRKPNNATPEAKV